MCGSQRQLCFRQNPMVTTIRVLAWIAIAAIPAAVGALAQPSMSPRNRGEARFHALVELVDLAVEACEPFLDYGRECVGCFR